MTCMEIWGGCDPADAAVSIPGLDAWIYSRPFREAAHEDPTGGGDIYYLSSCATGRINRLLVADVAGHGQAVREVAVSLRDMMRRFVNYLDQSRFVLRMNDQFAASAKAGTFATAVVTTFFSPTRTLSVCNAGHPPPLVWRAATGQWSLLDPSHQGERLANLPIGIMGLSDDECRQFDVSLEVGDMVLVYTDSLIEGRQPDGEMLGSAGLLLILQQLPPNPPPSLIPALLAAIENRTNRGLNADDVTALLLRASGTGATTPLKERLLAPLRIIKSACKSFLRREPAPLPDLTPANVGGAILPPLNRLWSRRNKSQPPARP